MSGYKGPSRCGVAKRTRTNAYLPSDPEGSTALVLKLEKSQVTNIELTADKVFVLIIPWLRYIQALTSTGFRSALRLLN